MITHIFPLRLSYPCRYSPVTPLACWYKSNRSSFDPFSFLTPYYTCGAENESDNDNYNCLSVKVQIKSDGNILNRQMSHRQLRLVPIICFISSTVFLFISINLGSSYVVLVYIFTNFTARPFPKKTFITSSLLALTLHYTQYGYIQVLMTSSTSWEDGLLCARFSTAL